MQRVWHCTKSWWPPIQRLTAKALPCLHVFERSHVQPLDQGWLAGTQTPERCAGSVSQEVQDQTLRAIWNGDEGIRRGAGRTVKEDTGTAEVLRPELCPRRFSQAEADN